MKLRPVIISLVVLVIACAVSITSLRAQKPQSEPGPVVAFEPALSPDGAEIAFISGGDIWTVPSAGGEAHILIAHPATESRPLYSPDGRYLAFNSNRSGNGDVYVLALASGELKRLTYDDANERAESWSPDSQWIYFSTSANDVSGMSDIYRVRRDGSTPMPVTADRYANEYQAAPSPDGASLAFVARGRATNDWWRNGHSHIDESEIWLKRLNAKSGTPYEMLVSSGAKQLWPMWSADGQTLYYTSDRTGTENLFAHRGGEEKQLTTFANGRVLWPTISRDGRLIAFERDFGIWLYDIASGDAHRVSVRLRGVPADVAIEHRRISDRIQDFTLSPDGKKLVFQVRGELYAASAKDGGDGFRITNTLGAESEPVWTSDNKRVIYASDRDGHSHLFLYDFTSQTETALTTGNSDNEDARVSPDGKSILFLRDRHQLITLDLATRKEQVVVSQVLVGPPLFDASSHQWSPDGKWIAYLDYAGRQFRNVKVVPATGGTPQAVSFLGNTNAGDLLWSPDGKAVMFLTTQRTEESRVARVDLTPRIPRFREDLFRDLFKDDKDKVPSPTIDVKAPEQTKPAESSVKKTGLESDGIDLTGAEPSKPKVEVAKPAPAPEVKDSKPETKIVFDNIRERMSFMRTGLDVSSHEVSPDGKWLAMVADAAGQQNIYIYPLDELSKEPPVAKQLTSSASQKSHLRFTPDSKELLYLDDGKIFRTSIDSPKPAPIAVSVEMDVDFHREKNEAFEQAWRHLRDNFYDDKMKGVDWNAQHELYKPLIASSRNGDEMRRLISLMIGELNASHMGISAPPETAARPSTGRLGLYFDPTEYENNGKLCVTEVVELSPADVAGINVGDYLIAVDGAKLDAKSNLQQVLEYKIDRRVTLKLADAKGVERTVSLKPTTLSTLKGLLYRQWVNRNRAYVDRISGGKLGYVHMQDMGQGSLNQLIIDLDTQNVSKEGVVIDIRNNNGGFVNAYAIDIFARRGYMNMAARGFGPAPARTVLGQRALELPTILVTNQHSLSDAEDFTEGYRTLGLGKVVGEPTAGWIIYTSGVQLIDGSFLRMPYTRITDHEGKDMELNPRAVDVAVERAMGESYVGKDSQLERAVSELVSQIEPAKLPPAKPAVH